MFTFGVILVVLLAGSDIASAQHDDMHKHGGQGEVGQVTFAVSCTPASRRQFGNAVAMLHSFWYEEAGQTFSEIVRNDPNCSMAYWGQAMSIYHPLWQQPSQEILKEGRTALLRAQAFGKKTPRERGYITALETFYRDNHPDYISRVQAYERAMEQLHLKNPKDDEAAVFYALSLVASAQALPADKTYAREKRAAGILNRVLRTQPRHPGVAHYLIHAYDFPALAHLAVDAARAYAKIAPAVPHALHMPSHIFIRLGLWQEAINSNLDSEKAAKDYGAKMRMVGAWDQQLHAMDYLLYAHLQMANDEKAKAVLDELRQITKTQPESPASAYALAAIPARYAIERRQWADATGLALRPQEFPWERYPWAEAIVSFARGLGAARKGDVAAAKTEVEKLASIEQSFAGAKGYNWANQVAIQKLTVSAWAAKAEGRKEDALRLMRAAADVEDSSDKHPVTPGPIVPARELLGELLLELGQPAEAMKEFEASLTASPRRFNGVFGVARAAELAGNTAMAEKYYQEVVTLSEGRASNRVELERAKAFLRKSARN
jgi:tetratricopeptide (TPR) repeat protein